MRRRKMVMVAWRGDAPAKKWRWARRINTPAESKGGVANECAGQKQEGSAAI
jgi:hypothetical protein